LDTFVCPYVNLPLLESRPCAVSSCAFNLADIPMSRAYSRCFLKYVKATGYNPHAIDEVEQIEYGALPLPYREHIAKILLNFNEEGDVEEAKRSFYIALFSIMTQDTTVSLTKRQHSPIPYRQCCVCGTPSDSLWLPKGGLLPSGYGYCSWACWQEMPPPLLSLMKMLEVDFKDMTDNFPFPHGQKSRLAFITHLTRRVFGDAPLT